MDWKQSKKLHEILADLLTRQAGYDETYHALEKLDNHPSFLRPAFRLLETLQSGNQYDFLGHLRQCLLYCGGDLPVSDALQCLVEREGRNFGLILKNHRVDALPRMMPDIDGLESTYQFVMNRQMHQVISDGRMYRYYRYGSYTSLAQKAINYYIANMEEKETLLACLPTGGGKSLSWQLPAMSYMWPGAIIVVVPTIALALDHARSSKANMQGILGDKRKVMAYTPSDMDESEKEKVMMALEEGDISILYISPESLTNERFKTSLLDAAEAGNISAFVVDEVHLVVSWGMRFRPEFQLLPALRNQLEELCPRGLGLRTILLSATLTSEDSKVLRKLFATERFTEVRADSLREEPSYYMRKCEDEVERRKCICQLLNQVPRPIIIYVDTLEQCDDYLKLVTEWGYSRVAAFSGRTDTETRKRLIKSWNNDEIDIMIATSAFGMGVDKSDVRTIITAYIPESISRFYQEVGRAGRDGYASLSYWLYVSKRDKDAVRNMMKSQVVGADNLVARWCSLRKGEKVLGHPECLIIDTSMKPKHLEGNRTGKLNAAWNKDVVLMLNRADLVDILDCEIKYGSDDTYLITVKMNDIECLQDDDKLKARIEPFRDEERAVVDEAMKAVDSLLKSDECFADALSEAFRDDDIFHMIPYTCHGCPSCRMREESFTEAAEANIDIRFGSNREKIYQGSRIPFDAAMFDMIHMRTEIAFLRRVSDDFVSMVTFMVRNQVNVIVADDFAAEGLLPALAFYDQYSYLLLTLLEAELLLDSGILDGTCALFYSSDADDVQMYQQFGAGFLESRKDNRIIHIFYEDCVAYVGENLVTDVVPTTWINHTMEDFRA